MSAFNKVKQGLVNPLVGTGSNGGKGKTSIKQSNSSGSEREYFTSSDNNNGGVRRSERRLSNGSDSLHHPRSLGSDEGSTRTIGSGSRLAPSFMRDTRSSSIRRNSGSSNGEDKPPRVSRARPEAPPEVMGRKRVSRAKPNNNSINENNLKQDGDVEYVGENLITTQGDNSENESQSHIESNRDSQNSQTENTNLSHHSDKGRSNEESLVMGPPQGQLGVITGLSHSLRSREVNRRLPDLPPRKSKTPSKVKDQGASVPLSKPSGSDIDVGEVVQRRVDTINNGEAEITSDKRGATNSMLMLSGSQHERLDNPHTIGKVGDMPPSLPIDDDYNAGLQIDQFIKSRQAPESGRTQSSSRVASDPKLNSYNPAVDGDVSQIRVLDGIRVENITGVQAKPATSIVPPNTVLRSDSLDTHGSIFSPSQAGGRSRSPGFANPVENNGKESQRMTTNFNEKAIKMPLNQMHAKHEIEGRSINTTYDNDVGSEEISCDTHVTSLGEINPIMISMMTLATLSSQV